MIKTNYAWFILAFIILIPFTLQAQAGPGGSVFRITENAKNGIRINFQLPDWELETVETKGETLSRVNIDGTQYIFIGEEETLPVFTTMIAVPYSGGVSLKELDVAEQSRTQVKLDFDSILANKKATGRYVEELYPEVPVMISEPKVLRDFRVVSVNVYPFQYDQDRKQLLSRQNMDIRIDFDGGPSVNEISPPQNYSSAFEPMYRGLILNYEDALDRETTYASPRMLVIYGNYSDTTYLAQVNSYVAWKRQKGFVVNSVSTATAGTSSTAIKSYIQSQYNNTSTRPDYIVLIGDATGNIQIPSYSSYIDYYYTWLAGNDNLGDAVIGRISVETTQDMIDYMAKINSLEQNLNLGTADWLDRMVLVGDTNPSGISQVYTNEYVYDASIAINPDYTYTKVYADSPSSTTINTAINQGVAFYNYRGYIGMSGWPSYMNQMNNAYKLFHAVFITCATGNYYNGTSTTEEVVRYGTAASLGGSVTAIGMATSSTHTPMNNCLDVGIFHGIYPLGMRDMGSAMLYGKLYLDAVYGVSNSTQAYNFAGYCNLIGDPTAEVYVSIPSTFNVTAPASIPAGTTGIEVSVLDAASQPVEGAFVTLTNTSGLQVIAFTDQQGSAVLEFSGSLGGNLTLTVDKNDFKPASSIISIESAGGTVFAGTMIDDDEDGPSSGNGDGIANSGETMELYVSLENTSSSTLLLSADASCSDPYVTLISSNRIEYDDLAPGETGFNINAIVLQIDDLCPDQYVIALNLSVESTGGNWSVMVPLIVSNGDLELVSQIFVGAPGNVMYPGDQYPMTISVINSGSMDLSGISAVLRSNDMFFTVPDSLSYYGDIPQNSTVTNDTDTFTVFARSTCIDGMVIPLSLELYNSSGFSQTLYMTVTIGQTTVNDPLGQDAYGYFIYDEGDTDHDLCPTYDWIGITPAEGGGGTALNLVDPGSSIDEGDQPNAVAIQTVNLPFIFKYYGVDYTQASISSNGFIAFGETIDADWRNWRLPDAGGPSPMVAVFWDDLDLVSGTSNVYTYYDASMHHFVVEWYNMISGYDSSTHQTFQAILYDPLYHPTYAGDGQIKLQYQDFNNIDLGDGDYYPHGNFCTIGIEDHTETIGLEYTFNNSYPPAAAMLSDESALFISTRPLIPDYPYVVIEQVFIYDDNMNNHLEPGESAELAIRLGNRGLQDATGISAVLSSVDPYVTISVANADYGTIPAQGNAYPFSNYAVSVAPGCPADHQIVFTLSITGDYDDREYNFPLGVFVPELSFSEMTVNDVTGDQNGILDPGETATLLIHLDNVGDIPCPAGTATLACSTPGITINSGTDTFPLIPAGDYELLSFNMSASSSMSDGTLVQLDFNATTNGTSASVSLYLEVGAPLEVVIGTGTGTQTYPLDRYYNYCAHESIYLASEVGMPGVLKSIAYYKEEGSDVNGITSVTIYMKNTAASSISGGTYSTAGYTQVYSGTFPNNATSGWMEVDLDPMFVYDGTSNLGILIVKGHQQWISSYPRWTYTTTPTTRARQNRSDYSAPTDLVASNNLPNLRLKIFSDIEMNLPPQDFTATGSHQSVYLTWSQPVSGAPDSYNIYRDGSLLTSVETLSHTDLDVTNGTEYSYYLTAVYTEGESEPTQTETATPNIYSPTNLVAIPGDSIVDLNWVPAEGRRGILSLGTKNRAISGYRVYRDGSPVTTIPGTSYQDTGLTNGVSYSYYVTTVYADPAGESEPSNTVAAIPSIVDFVILGTGTSVSYGYQNSPINICNNSVHGQSVYTAAELNAAGITGPILITGLGFNVISAPDYSLLDFVVRIKHTTAVDAETWHTADDLVTVYSNASYMPVAGGYDMLHFTTPFEWNGTDNILVDTAFGLIPISTDSGTLQYTSMTNGYRFAWSDTADQTNVFSGGIAVNRRPNVRLEIQPVQIVLDAPVVEITYDAQNTILSWNAVSNADEYHVYSASEPDGAYTQIGTATGLSFTDERGLGKAFYYVKVVAY